MLQKKRSRKAGAVVELAVSLPLLFLLVMGSIETCTMIFLDHSLTVTAYEGIRVAVRYDSTTEMTRDRCEEIIAARRVNGAVVEIVPEDVSAVERGEPIAVTISAPCVENSAMAPWFYGGRTMSARITMVKE